MLRVIGCITQQHDLRLVALAACICALACGTTINLMARARKAPARSSVALLLVASAVFGCGVWSLHFVAMLAFIPGIPISYSVPATIGSIVIVVPGALLAFLVWRFARPGLAAGVLSGGLLGLAVAGMHYTGADAMRLPGELRFDPSFVVASIAIGIGFAAVGFARAGLLISPWRRLEVAAWWALGICGMHFTAMAALTLQLGRPMSTDGTVLGSGPLAIAVGSVSVAILIVSLSATLMERYLSDRRQLELEHMRLLSNVAREALIIQRDGIVLQANAACARMFGVPARQLVGRRALELVVEADRPGVTRQLRDHQELLRSRTPSRDARTDVPPHGADQRDAATGMARGEIARGEMANGEIATGEISGAGINGEVPSEIRVRAEGGIAVSVELSCGEIVYEGRPATVMSLLDLSDRKGDEAKIRHFAHHDVLTGLPNRFLLAERITHDLAVASRSGATLGLLYLDLDRFKPVNDLLGHAAGDELLIQVAARLRSELRTSDTVARIGGDEFVIIATGDEPVVIAALAQRLLEAMARPFDLLGHSAEIGTSIGIALYPGDGDSQQTLMHAADTALYSAKQSKRGTFRFFEAAMDKHLQVRRTLENDLRQAVGRNQLVLHYQPLISCATGEVEGFEALLRWNHPERGMVSPADFIPLAEETGLIVPIGQWVLETACAAAMRWGTGQWLAVNVSPVQFRQPELFELVAATLARTGLPASRLELEITEGVFVDEVARTGDVLKRLRAIGVRIALDDFGTGYSSLSYLRSYSFDKLKIDKSFIDRLGQADDASMIVRTIVGLAHDLGLSIVAEGVETPRQLAMVRAFMCDQVQGYLVGRPVRMDVPGDITPEPARLSLFGRPNLALPNPRLPILEVAEETDRQTAMVL
jgi:diguanylate cyclase (GGDEF)-like protein